MERDAVRLSEELDLLKSRTKVTVPCYKILLCRHNCSVFLEGFPVRLFFFNGKVSAGARSIKEVEMHKWIYTSWGIREKKKRQKKNRMRNMFRQ